MRWSLPLLATLATACGASTSDGQVDTVDSTSEALGTAPNGDIFSISPRSPAGWSVEYIGPSTAPCIVTPGSSTCKVDEVDLAGTGLDASAQSSVLAKIASNDGREGATAVLLRGSTVNLRDRRGTTIFRAVAAYTAPSVHAHATNFVYLKPVAADRQGMTSVNPLQLSPTYWVSIGWALPPGNAHPSGVIDDAMATILPLPAPPPDPGPITTKPGISKPIAVTVDQLFSRVR